MTGIAASSYADGHQELFAIVGGEIRHRWYWADTNWSPWHQQAPVGTRATDIAVSSLREGHIEVFALNDDGRDPAPLVLVRSRMVRLAGLLLP